MIIDYNPSNLNKKDISEKEEKVRTGGWKQLGIWMQLTRVFPPAYALIFQCSCNYS